MFTKLLQTFKKISLFLRTHKISTVILIAGLIGGGFWWHQQSAKASQSVTRYVLGAVTRGTIVASITGTGQVEASSSISITSQASGKITALKVKVNQTVKTGEVIAVLDQRSAARSVEQASASLASAQANYTKVVAGKTSDDLLSYRSAVDTATLSLEQAKHDTANSISSAESAVDTAQNNLKQAEGGDSSQIMMNAYQTALVTVQAVPAKLDDLLTQADNILGVDNNLANASIKPYLASANPGLLNTATMNYLQAKADRDQARTLIQTLSKTSAESDIDKALDLSEKAATSMNVVLTNISDILSATPPVGALTQSTLDSLKSSTQGNRGAATSQLSTITNQRQNIVSARDSLVNYQIAYDKAVQDLNIAKQNADTSLASKQLSLSQASDSLAIQSKPPLATDIASAQAQVTSALAQLHAAQDAYADTIVTAPFDGVIAALPVHQGDTVGGSTALATLITQQKLAQISLNEVDVAKLNVGQKVTLSFDALEGLTISGTVSQIDTLGIVTQGVVNYTVQIAFDTQDDRIKPGMSVQAAIIVNSKPDILTVPNSAIKSFGIQSYVELVDSHEVSSSTVSTSGGVTLKTPPEQQPVEVGVANDTMTEIISGLNEGDTVVVQTISSAQSTTRTPGNASGLNLLRGAGGGAAGFSGGNVRIGGMVPGR